MLSEFFLAELLQVLQEARNNLLSSFYGNFVYVVLIANLNYNLPLYSIVQSMKQK